MSRVRILMAAVAVWLALVASVSAQVIDPGQYIAASSSDCSTTGSCATFLNGVAGSPAVTVTISGNAGGNTLQFETTADGILWTSASPISNTGTNDSSTASTSTVTYSFTNGGIIGVRVRCSTYVSGQVKVSLTKGWAAVKLLSPTTFTTVADGSASAPSIAFKNESTLGFYRPSAGNIGFTGNLVDSTGTHSLVVRTIQMGGTSSSFAMIKGPGITARLADDSGYAGITAQQLLLDATFSPGGSSPSNGMYIRPFAGNAPLIPCNFDCSRLATVYAEGIKLCFIGDFACSTSSTATVATINSENGLTIYARNAGNTADIEAIAVDGSNIVQIGNANAASINVNAALLPQAPKITAGAATGLTVSNTGEARTVVYKVTLDKTAFVCAATTCDVTIATLPANTWLLNVTASLTQTFACTATCTTSTLSAVLGKGSGGSEYLASADMDAATAIFGDADAEMGTLLTRAAAIQGGTFTSSSQAVVFRLVSGTGNIGTGATTNLSQGSITMWLTTRVLP